MEKLSQSQAFSYVPCSKMVTGERQNHTPKRSQDKHITHTHPATQGHFRVSQPGIEPRTFSLRQATMENRTYFGQKPAEQQQQQGKKLGYIHSVGMGLDFNSPWALEKTRVEGRLRSDCAPRLCALPVEAPHQSDCSLPPTHPPALSPPPLSLTSPIHNRTPRVPRGAALTSLSRSRGRMRMRLRE